MSIAAIIFPVWIMSQLTYNAGVARTSITSSTVASSTSVIWTYLASVFYLRESGTRRKVLGVALCFVGNCILVVPDMTHKSHEQAGVGTLLCIASAIGYAAYTTMIKLWVTEDVSLLLFLACIGTCSMCVALPFAPLVDPQWHLGVKTLAAILCVGLIDNVLGQYLWAKGVLYTSSTVATAGMSLTIPLALVADICTGHGLDMIHLLASASVLAGFMLMYRPEQEIESELS